MRGCYKYVKDLNPTMAFLMVEIAKIAAAWAKSAVLFS